MLCFHLFVELSKLFSLHCTTKTSKAADPGCLKPVQSWAYFCLMKCHFDSVRLLWMQKCQVSDIAFLFVGCIIDKVALLHVNNMWLHFAGRALFFIYTGSRTSTQADPDRWILPTQQTGIIFPRLMWTRRPWHMHMCMHEPSVYVRWNTAVLVRINNTCSERNRTSCESRTR